VYPKAWATELAKASNALVPAIAVDVTDVAALKTAPIVAIPPEAKAVRTTAAFGLMVFRKRATATLQGTSEWISVHSQLMAVPSSSRTHVASVQEALELAIVWEVAEQPARHDGRARHVTLSDLHVPQREFGFHVTEEV